ncbi:sulfotransferase ssu-1-like isoform X2 [Amblyomma americanum]
MAAEVTAPPKSPIYVDVDGVRINKRFSPDVVRDALRYKATPDDVFLASFPKCGTHWTQQICYLIEHNGVPPPTVLHLHMHGPSLEKFGAQTVRALPKRGYIRTHLPYDLVPKHPKARYVYVCRNPKDVCVSLFYQTKSLKEYGFADGKFEDFFEIFLEGETDFGNYFEHVLPWYAHRDDDNVLFLNYEQMKSEPRKYILKLAEFLDRGHYRELVENESMLQDVLKFSSFEYMKKPFPAADGADSVSRHLTADVPEAMRVLFETPGSIRGFGDVLRAGKTGGWKEHFSPKMNERMEKKILDKFSHTDLVATWMQFGIL